MKIVRVFMPSDEPTHDSFEEAVVAVQGEPRTVRAESDSQVLQGRRIEMAFCTNNIVTFVLSGNQTLRIWVDGRKVCWDVTQERYSVSPGTESYPENVLLKFPNRHKLYQWDRRTLLNQLLNRSLQHLSASVSWLFLTVEGCPTLMFNLLVNSDSNDNLLFFGPE